MLKTLSGWLVFLGLWQAGALLLHNPILLPGPAAVGAAMAGQLLSPGFFPAIAHTLARVVVSVLLSGFAAMALALAAVGRPALQAVLDQAIQFLRTIPNVSFIILVLFWTGRNLAVYAVLFLLLMPLAYTSFYARLEEIHREWLPVFTLFPQPFRVRLQKVVLPLCAGTIQAWLLSAFSLAFKACVTTEVLCQSMSGIGRSLQASRFLVDTAGVMGWTLWLVLLSFLVRHLLQRVAKGQTWNS